MKILQKLPGHSSIVDLVEVHGKKYVRKTMHPEELWNEKAFIEVLKKNGIPCLSYHPHKLLGNNQLLLTYVEGSPTLGDTPKAYDFFRVGKTMRMMHNVTFPHSYRITETGKEESTEWGAFLKQQALEAKGNTHLPRQLKDQVHRTLEPLYQHSPNQYSLLHCDLHTNNMIAFNNSIAFFDKGSAVFSGDKLYDLGLFYFNFVHVLYLGSTHQEEQQEREYLKAFIEGYKADPLREFGPLLERYMLHRAFDRIPSKFEPYLEPLILKLLERLS